VFRDIAFKALLRYIL